MFPGAKGIAAEPAPQSSVADLSEQALGNNVLSDFLNREPRQWEPEGVRKLAGECLNLNDETGGKAGFTPASRLRLKARQSGKGESLTPLAVAIESSVCRSSLERFTLNGLFLGIRDTIPLMRTYQTTSPIRPLKYVIVFPNNWT
jgi:hypothetical protein